jgi:hypothetical protein
MRNSLAKCQGSHVMMSGHDLLLIKMCGKHEPFF